mmetsp:Transcript_30114/g.30596  ORF Transcript_30114/g.30596 Transcript_30114/m.30596 type:complete len:407 (-) Transcript_30114:307-1527(-)
MTLSAKSHCHMESHRGASPKRLAGVNLNNTVVVKNYFDHEWSLEDNAVPRYESIINFARSNIRGDHHCVMCGGRKSSGCVIPSQNKDVCKSCDSSFWLHKNFNVVVKFCKGCKNFVTLNDFSGKPDASKCTKCRERGRSNYISRKTNMLSNTMKDEPLNKKQKIQMRGQLLSSISDFRQLSGAETSSQSDSCHANHSSDFSEFDEDDRRSTVTTEASFELHDYDSPNNSYRPTVKSPAFSAMKKFLSSPMSSISPGSSSNFQCHPFVSAYNGSGEDSHSEIFQSVYGKDSSYTFSLGSTSNSNTSVTSHEDQEKSLSLTHYDFLTAGFNSPLVVSRRSLKCSALNFPEPMQLFDNSQSRNTLYDSDRENYPKQTQQLSKRNLKNIDFTIPTILRRKCKPQTKLCQI